MQREDISRKCIPYYNTSLNNKISPLTVTHTEQLNTAAFAARTDSTPKKECPQLMMYSACLTNYQVCSIWRNKENLWMSFFNVCNSSRKTAILNLSALSKTEKIS